MSHYLLTFIFCLWGTTVACNTNDTCIWCYTYSNKRGREPLGISGIGLLWAIQWSMSKHWMKHKALTLTSGLAFIFVIHTCTPDARALCHLCWLSNTIITLLSIRYRIYNVGHWLFVFLFLDEIVTGSIQTPVIKPDLNKANPKLGVGTVNFSANCQYMYSKNGECFCTCLTVNRWRTVVNGTWKYDDPRLNMSHEGAARVWHVQPRVVIFPCRMNYCVSYVLSSYQLQESWINVSWNHFRLCMCMI